VTLNCYFPTVTEQKI